MRLAAPEAVGRKRQQMRVADKRRRHTSRDHIERVIAADAGQIEHLRPTIDADTRREKIMSMRLAEQRRYQIAASVEIGGDEDQLAKTRLSEILDEHLR